MYVIKRIDAQGEHDNRITCEHETLEEAVVEAQRLARKHAMENAVFEIFRMVSQMKIRGDVVVSLEDTK